MDAHSRSFLAMRRKAIRLSYRAKFAGTQTVCTITVTCAKRQRSSLYMRFSHAYWKQSRRRADTPMAETRMEEHSNDDVLPHTTLAKTICVFCAQLILLTDTRFYQFIQKSRKMLGSISSHAGCAEPGDGGNKSLEGLPQDYKPDAFPSLSSIVTCSFQTNTLKAKSSR